MQAKHNSPNRHLTPGLWNFPGARKAVRPLLFILGVGVVAYGSMLLHLFFRLLTDTGAG